MCLEQETILTIAIPTYNRVLFLEECLESVLTQVYPGVELIVFDNASTDGTKALMQRYLSHHPWIRYYRNEINLGSDANFLRCLMVASGQYVHLLSDDDVLLPGCVSTIISLVIGHGSPVSFVYLNLSLFSTPYKVGGVFHPHFEIEHDTFFNTKEDFIAFVGVYITFVSSMVFNSELLRRVIKPERFIGTSLLQAHMALETILLLRHYPVVCHTLCWKSTRVSRVTV